MTPQSNAGQQRMADTQALPDLETAYQTLRPMLFGGLGKLSRQGFSILPSDGLDVIHDFFVDEWDKVIARYNPDKGKLESYVYAAFINFARPRLIRLQRLQGSLTDPQELNRMGDEDEPLAEEPQPSDPGQLFDRILKHLPEEDRALLSEYIRSGRSPERALARTHGISRYKLREKLIEALGRFAVFLQQPTGIPDRDWRVASALWHDQRSTSEAARVLGLTESQVRNSQKRNQKYLVEAVRRYQS